MLTEVPGDEGITTNSVLVRTTGILGLALEESVTIVALSINMVFLNEIYFQCILSRQGESGYCKLQIVNNISAQ